MQKLSYLPIEKLTPLWSQEQTIQISETLNKRHSSFLENEHFEVIGGFHKNQLQLNISLNKNDYSVAYPIECLFIKDSDDPIQYSEIAFLILDYMDAYWAEYFIEERAVFVPIDWHTYECNGIKFYIRGSIRHIDLEMQADNFLNIHGHGEYEIHSISSET